jgi:hypothetical protein
MEKLLTGMLIVVFGFYNFAIGFMSFEPITEGRLKDMVLPLIAYGVGIAGTICALIKGFQ